MNKGICATNALNFETLMTGVISGQMSHHHQSLSIPSPHDQLHHFVAVGCHAALSDSMLAALA